MIKEDWERAKATNSVLVFFLFYAPLFLIIGMGIISLLFLMWSTL